MPLNGSPNVLKAKLAQAVPQIGIWTNLCSPLVAGLLAGAGFDWILVDSEHVPNDLPSIVAQLQAIAAYLYRSTVVRHRVVLMRPSAPARAERHGPGPVCGSRAARRSRSGCRSA